MPKTPKKKSSEGEVVKKSDIPKKDTSVMSETFQAQLLHIFGEQDNYKPTEAQVDKLLALQEKGMDYTHEERMSFKPKQKIELGVFISVVFAFIAIIWIVSEKAPDHMGEAITGAIGFLSGVAGGYGYGRANKKDDAS